jgi:hypothetical protein
MEFGIEHWKVCISADLHYSSLQETTSAFDQVRGITCSFQLHHHAADGTEARPELSYVQQVQGKNLNTTQ